MLPLLTDRSFDAMPCPGLPTPLSALASCSVSVSVMPLPSMLTMLARFSGEVACSTLTTDFLEASLSGERASALESLNLLVGEVGEMTLEPSLMLTLRLKLLRVMISMGFWSSFSCLQASS